MRGATRNVLVLLAALPVIAACGSGQAGDAPPPVAADSAVAVERTDSANVAATLEPGMLRTVAAVPAAHWTGPGGQPFEVTTRSLMPAGAHARRFGTTSLGISLRDRSPALGQYPCASCHIGRAIVMRDERVADAHENLVAKHPSLTGARCSTCHSADNVELLALKSGESASLDHVYRVCSECHSAQATAWAAGAHGKRLDGWQGRRVVMGCADCHDPHDPSLERRIPFKAPRIGRQGVHR
jgi:hypothetical protein